MESINPATGKRIRSYAEYYAQEIDGMLGHTYKAFKAWKRMSYAQRGECLKKAAAVLIENKEIYAGLIADEMGKPMDQGRGEIEKCALVCNFYAEEGEKFLKEEIVKTDAARSLIAYEPLGIVLGIMPWNFPFWQVFRAAAPTLMAGNAMALKHASNVCGCAMAIEEVFKKAGFPDGLFSAILISSPKVEYLIRHPLISAVTLTGSTGAGKNVAAIAGNVIKKSVLELGGSDAYVILEDADLDLAAQVCVNSRMINGGQSCVSAKRFITVAKIREEFQAKFVERMRDQKMGPPREEGVTLGPLARHDLRDGLYKQVQRSVGKGAMIAAGGELPPNPGAFFPPTVLFNVTKGMPAYDEELFGPVASIIEAADEAEAINLANDSVFGLGAAVFTKDTQKGEAIARQLETGCCFVNAQVKSDPRLPFGGIKQSGYGRELASVGIREFVNVKTIYVK